MYRIAEVKVMKKEKTLRMAITSALLLTVIAGGISMYRTGKDSDRKEPVQQEEAKEKEEQQETGKESQDVTVNEAQAEHTEELGEVKEETEEEEVTSTQTAETKEEKNEETPETEGQEVQENSQQETADASAVTVPELNFTEDSQMLWPVNGQVLIDYSMDATTYFPTLDQYKYHDALVLGCEAGEPIQAAANGKVVSIRENEETGTTMVMDLGNGYQAEYGQMKEVAVEEGQTVESGTILGYVSEPTKYYVEEGANLYFAMKKDGKAIDPMIYIETVTE